MISNRGKVVLSTRNPAIYASSHKSKLVTITTTMKNGSLLVDNTEASKADSSVVNGVIDDPKFDEGFYQVGETHLISVCFGNATINEDRLTFSDGSYSSEDLTVLKSFGAKFTNVETDFSLVLGAMHWYNKTTGVIKCGSVITCNEELILCL